MAAMSWAEQSSVDDSPAQNVGARGPRILCTGIIVLDKVFHVEKVPQRDSKVKAKDFFIVSGGCAANAASPIFPLSPRALARLAE